MAWARLRHNYGAASDVPSLLNDCTDADPARAAAALDDLDTRLFHQGGHICPAAVAALPYLLDLASEPAVPVRLGAIELIARLAAEAGLVQPRFLDPGWPDAAAAAVPRMVALLADPDPRVRRAATSLVGTLPFSDAVDALWRRWSAETDRVTRLDLVLAFGEVLTARPDLPDAAGIRAELHRLLTADDLQTRLAAVHALAPTEPDVAVAEVATAVRAVRHPDAAVWQESEWSGGQRSVMVGATAALLRHDPTAATAFTLGVGAGAGGRDEVVAVLETAGALLEEWRTVTPAVLPLLADRLDHPDPEVRYRAVYLLGCLGREAADLGDRIAALADDPAVRDSRRRSTVGDAAVWALARRGDPRCVAGLVERLAGPRLGFDPSAGHFGRMPHFPLLPPGVEETLVPLRAYADRLLPGLIGRVAAIGADDTPVSFAGFLRVLHAWGAVAAPAVPTLVTLLRHATAAPFAALALGGIGPAAGTAAEALRRLATDHPDAAWAYWRVGGDPEVAVAALAAHTARAGHTAVRHLADLGPHAAVAADRLRHLATAGDDVWTHVEAAHALWRVTGDADTAVPVLTAVAAPLADGECLPVYRTAFRYLAALGASRHIASAVLGNPRRVAWGGGWRAFLEDEEVRAIAGAPPRA